MHAETYPAFLTPRDKNENENENEREGKTEQGSVYSIYLYIYLSDYMILWEQAPDSYI